MFVGRLCMTIECLRSPSRPYLQVGASEMLCLSLRRVRSRAASSLYLFEI